jgi:hypothetical protein
MSLNPIKWLHWLITEHWSSTILRDRLGQAKDRIETLERQKKEEISKLRQRHSEEIFNLNKSHSQEMNRLTKLYSEGKGILPPKGFFKQEEDGQHKGVS